MGFNDNEVSALNCLIMDIMFIMTGINFGLYMCDNLFDDVYFNDDLLEVLMMDAIKFYTCVIFPFYAQCHFLLSGFCYFS